MAGCTRGGSPLGLRFAVVHLEFCLVFNIMLLICSCSANSVTRFLDNFPRLLVKKLAFVSFEVHNNGYLHVQRA